MKYVGITTQQRSNNIKSMLLLLCFPGLLLVLFYAFMVVLGYLNADADYDSMGYSHKNVDFAAINASFITIVPWVTGFVFVWFCISYFFNSYMIRHATGAVPIERKDNPRVYNILENLTMSCGMSMPNLCVVDDPQLNAFASGIDDESYTVTLTTGIIDRLNDDELAGVIGHELTHIRNRDTRLLIISIVFVGIMSFILNVTTRVLWNTFVYGGSSSRRSSNGKGSSGVAVLVVIVIAAVLAALGYFFTVLTRLAISRKREYMADAGGAELCGNPIALASALRKISSDTGLENVRREDVSQLFICCPAVPRSERSLLSNLFSTHPSIESRIAYLLQF